LTYSCGVKLVKACRTYQNADVEISKRANIIESIWYRISKQVEFLRDTCEELEPEFIRIQDGLLMSLVTELSVAAGKLESLSKVNKRDKVKYVVVKPSLDVAISSLEAWQRRFDPAWYMTLKELKSTSNRIVDDHGSNAMETAKKVQIALSSGDPTGLTQLFLPLLKKAESTNIHDSTAMVLRDTARVNGIYIVDPLQCQGVTHAEELEGDVRALVRKLRAVDPVRFSMLQCSGAQRKKSEAGTLRYELVFNFPENSSGEQPTSLATLIASAKYRQHSLSERLKIAQQLTRAVCYVHALDFVHKNIRPRSVLAFPQTRSTLGSVYLVGFEMFRREGGNTRLIGDSDWEKNVYRHPERQGDHPETAHRMQHDIYSLGVCLLEIGLWKPIIPLVADAKSTRPDGENAMEVQESIPLPQQQVKTKFVKTKFESLADTLLPSVMGDQYRDVVVNCLTCLDDENVEFADTSVSTGVKYIQMVCRHVLLSIALR
jgi:serine/threonine protein kinase